MKTKNTVLSLFLLAFSSVNSHAASSTYCDGYVENFKSVPGHDAISARDEHQTHNRARYKKFKIAN